VKFVVPVLGITVLLTLKAYNSTTVPSAIGDEAVRLPELGSSYWHCPRSMRSRVYATVRCPSDYTLLLILAGVDTLEARRDQLTERFLTRSVLPESSCLHYLLPD